MSSITTPQSSAPLVVVAFLDGRRPRGYMYDFSPVRDRCRLFPSLTAKADQAEQVELQNLKAIFFLREMPGPAPGEAPPATAATATVTATPANKATPAPAQGRKIEVVFADKERLHGTTTGFSRDRQGFFMIPEDPTGKILRVFVINKNAKEIKWL